MDKIMVLENDGLTGKEVLREMTSEELAQFDSDNINFATQTEIKSQAATDKAALLAKLGITADEAKLLLG